MEFEKFTKMLKTTMFDDSDVNFILVPDSLKVLGINKSKTVAVLCDLAVTGSTAQGIYAISGEVADKMSKKKGSGNATISFNKEIVVNVGGDTYKISTVGVDEEYINGIVGGLFTENIKNVKVVLLCGIPLLKQKLDNLDVEKHEAVPLNFEGNNLVVGSELSAGLLSYIGKMEVKVLAGEDEKIKFSYAYNLLVDALDRVSQFNEEVSLMFTKDGLLFMVGYIGTKSKIIVAVAPRLEVEGAVEGEE
jgi:hypothetical protein